MHCLDVPLEAYVGELDPEQAARLEQHLSQCAACRSELGRLRAVAAAARNWPLVAEPDGLTARVMARIKTRPAARPFRIRWSDLAVSLAGAGLTSITALAGYVLLRPHLPALQWESVLFWRQVFLLARGADWNGIAAWVALFVGLAACASIAAALWGLVQGARRHPVLG